MMSSDLNKIAILFNGPPRAGKDTAVNALIASMGADVDVIKFTGPVKDLTHRLYGLACQQDAYEISKDLPLSEFRGKTPRQAYIETSTELRRRDGDDAVAKLFVASVLSSSSSIVLNPDCGGNMEAQAVVDALGVENVLIVRISKEGHDFSNDCRDWVSLENLTIVDVENTEGHRRDFESKIASHVYMFIEKHIGKIQGYPVA